MVAWRLWLSRWRGRHGLLESLCLVPHAVLGGLCLDGALGCGRFWRFFVSRLRRRRNGHGQRTRAPHMLRQGAGDVLPQLGLDDILGVLVRGGDQRVAITDHDGFYKLKIEALAMGEIGYVRTWLFGLSQ